MGKTFKDEVTNKRETFIKRRKRERNWNPHKYGHSDWDRRSAQEDMNGSYEADIHDAIYNNRTAL